MSGMRRAMAHNVQASLQGMAQLTLFTELDGTELVRLRERLQREFALTYTDLIVHAVARGLGRPPAPECVWLMGTRFDCILESGVAP